MKRVFDPSTLLGIMVAMILILWAISSGGDGIKQFLDLPSFLIVIVGTFFLTTASFSLRDVLKTYILVARTIFYKNDELKEAATSAIDIAVLARKNGLLDLHKVINRTRKYNPFLKKGLEYVIDGIAAEEAEQILENEIDATLERHKKGTAILNKAAEIAPAMGLVGTLIGLVQMLSNLSDPSKIGPAMAIALLTTLYGAVFSYVVLYPLASKLEKNSRSEALIMQLYLCAIGSIARKENPRRLEILMNALMPPAYRVNYFKDTVAV
jgi:chemotaxis protein MotA